MKRYLTALAALVACAGVQAATVDVPVNSVSPEGVGQSVGHITITETEYGLLFTPSMASLPTGVHGFHVHEKGSCDAGMKDGKSVAALAAGGHFDPEKPVSTWGRLMRQATWGIYLPCLSIAKVKQPIQYWLLA